jgi:hypothetical protein
VLPEQFAGDTVQLPVGWLHADVPVQPHVTLAFDALTAADAAAAAQVYLRIGRCFHTRSDDAVGVVNSAVKEVLDWAPLLPAL